MLNLADLSAHDKDRAQEKARALVEGAAVSGPLTEAQETSVRNVFQVLHGWYGNLFLSRFITGVVLPEEDENAGEDEGIVNARRMWAFALRTYSGQTIKAALGGVRTAHAEFPPNLPQFEALCRARMPRGPVADASAVLKIEMGQPLRSQYARQARAINEKHLTRRAQAADGFRPIQPGLAGLKEAIADAVGAAGGDEAAALVRLDREFAKANHE